MSEVLNRAVTQYKDDASTFQCPGIRDSRCGDLEKELLH